MAEAHVAAQRADGHDAALGCGHFDLGLEHAELAIEPRRAGAIDERGAVVDRPGKLERRPGEERASTRGLPSPRGSCTVRALVRAAAATRHLGCTPSGRPVSYRLPISSSPVSSSTSSRSAGVARSADGRCVAQRLGHPSVPRRKTQEDHRHSLGESRARSLPASARRSRLAVLAGDLQLVRHVGSDGALELDVEGERRIRAEDCRSLAIAPSTDSMPCAIVSPKYERRADSRRCAADCGRSTTPRNAGRPSGKTASVQTLCALLALDDSATG